MEMTLYSKWKIFDCKPKEIKDLYKEAVRKADLALLLMSYDLL